LGPELQECCGTVVVSLCFKKLIGGNVASAKTQRKGNVHSWEPVPEEW
jgi:hypothetical protein